jgi:hypothetical protein
MTYEIIVEEFSLQVQITDLTDTPADPTSWESPADFYGCRELEFSVVSGRSFAEDGSITELGANGCVAAAELHAEYIEEQLWEIIDAKKEDAMIDRYEARQRRNAA